MLANLSKKEVKKWRKIKVKYSRDGLMLTDEKSCKLILANAGLGNGISVDQVLDLVKPFGNVTDIKSSCDKPYALLAFTLEDEAVHCMEALQGAIVNKSAEEFESTIYIYYLKSFPDEDIPITALETNSLPYGLHKLEDFITLQEELELLENIEEDMNHAFSARHVNETLKQRAVLHYGYKFQYGSNDVDCSSPLTPDLPAYTEKLLKMFMKTGLFQSIPDQLTINKYSPGDGIPHHIDNVDAFDGVLATLSLSSQAVMEMKNPENRKVSILLKPRTLLVFTGESRFKWSHCIPARKTDVVFDEATHNSIILKRKTRISMTFRKVLPVFKDKPNKDTQNEIKHEVLPCNQKKAVVFERDLVCNVYSKIACHFSCTREKPWPRVVEFLHNLEGGSLVLDVGCGSGRYLNVNPEIFMLGCDNCLSLTEICSNKNYPVFICDGLKVPVRSGSFDAAICIAVIHHFSTYERRLSAVTELMRVTRKGGLCLIYVWAAEQKLNNTNSSYIKPNHGNNNPELPHALDPQLSKEKKLIESNDHLVVHKNRTEFVQQDVLVPWTMKPATLKVFKNTDAEKQTPTTFYRFYHVFKQNELESLSCKVPNCVVINSYYDNGNWGIILQKQ